MIPAFLWDRQQLFYIIMDKEQVQLWARRIYITKSLPISSSRRITTSRVRYLSRSTIPFISDINTYFVNEDSDGCQSKRDLLQNLQVTSCQHRELSILFQFKGFCVHLVLSCPLVAILYFYFVDRCC